MTPTDRLVRALTELVEAAQLVLGEHPDQGRGEFTVEPSLASLVCNHALLGELIEAREDRLRDAVQAGNAALTDYLCESRACPAQPGPALAPQPHEPVVSQTGKIIQTKFDHYGKRRGGNDKPQEN